MNKLKEMNKAYLVALSAFVIIAIQSCAKKTIPSTTVPTVTTVVKPAINNDTSVVVKKNDTLVVKKEDSVVAAKPVIKPKPKESIPKVIVVNDKFANKSVDGRYYYDLQGHRYWRNNKDGKYYLFNKSMLTDDAFKKQD